MKDYLRCVASIDDNTGRLLDWLDATGRAGDRAALRAELIRLVEEVGDDLHVADP